MNPPIPKTLDKELSSRLCTQKDWNHPYHQYWMDRMGYPMHYHRKYWEWSSMSQWLWESARLKPAVTALAFAVGQEPLPAVYASFGVTVVATDQAGDTPEAQRDWAATGMLAKGKAVLNEKNLCPPDEFERLVSFRHVDMNAIPDDLKKNQFDFIWSSCSMEHIGGITKGLDFAKEAMKCVKPGGIAIHTTEFCCNNDHHTIDAYNLCFFRKSDFAKLKDDLMKQGDYMYDVDYDLGDGEWDHTSDDLSAGFNLMQHLKINLSGFLATSAMLIIRKGG